MSREPLAYFDKIFILNLPARADRRREMQEQLQTIGMGLDAPGVELFAAVRPPDKGDFESIGARGCFMSHLGMLRKAADAGHERIVIFEDDLNFTADFKTRAPATLELLAAQPWDVFYGGYRYEGESGLAAGVPAIPADAVVGCTHFIALQAPAIERAAVFLQTLLQRPAGDPDGGPMHVDGAYSWLRRQNPTLVTRLAAPQLGYQRASRTDIHTTSWFDQIPLVRTAVQHARKLRNRARSGQ